MDINTLKLEQEQMIASLSHWQGKATEAQQAQQLAQNQIMLHNGHLERINMWIKRMEEVQKAPAKVEVNGNTDRQTAMEILREKAHA